MLTESKMNYTKIFPLQKLTCAQREQHLLQHESKKHSLSTENQQHIQDVYINQISVDMPKLISVNCKHKQETECMEFLTESFPGFEVSIFPNRHFSYMTNEDKITTTFRFRTELHISATQNYTEGYNVPLLIPKCTVGETTNYVIDHLNQ